MIYKKGIFTVSFSFYILNSHVVYVYIDMSELVDMFFDKLYIHVRICQYVILI